MCGIIGIITKTNARQKAVAELLKLEYRGYDSAGVAVVDKDAILTTKQVGAIANLKKVVDKVEDNFTTAIAHTRWATHGKANLTNCHPHMSNDKTWAVVHNGIIENYSQLKTHLKANSIKLKSQTDSEVIPNLLQLSTLKGIDALIDVCNKLIGSYALACINAKDNNKLYLARKNSPLYIADSLDGIIVSSDIVSFVGKTDKYYIIGNDEFVVADKSDIKFYDKNRNILTKRSVKLNITNTSATLDNFQHFMLKEIYQVPSLLKDVKRYYLNNQELIFDLKQILSSTKHIMMVGCGTAYHSGLMGERFFNKYLHIPTTSHIASEFCYDNLSITKDTTCIFISQSGETADTIAALKYAQSKGAKCVALTNNINSQIAFLADYTLPILAGVEIAVASTKAYNCQCLCLYILSQLFDDSILQTIADTVDYLSLSLKNIDSQQISTLADNVKNYTSVFFIGRGIDYVTSLEASLKLKEISYINSIACQAGELKHGTLALIDQDSLVVMTITDPALKEKSINALHEIKARDAKVILLSPFEDISFDLGDNDAFISLPDFQPQYLHQVAICNMQLLAYYVSVKKGLNPDKPRNLAKSVTVE